MPSRGFLCIDGAPLHCIVQHACPNRRPADLVNLLLTSKKTKEAVLEACKGQIAVQLPEGSELDNMLGCVSWLAKYGLLASSLEFTTPQQTRSGVLYAANGDRFNASAAELALAAALQQAACKTSTIASAGGLQLQSCTLGSATASISAVLQQLPASSLHSLSLEIHDKYPSEVGVMKHQDQILPSWSASGCGCVFLQPLTESISHLTRLRGLTITLGSDLYGVKLMDAMLPQLSALTQLSRLQLSNVTHEAPFHALPASLKELFFKLEFDGYDPWPVRYFQLKLDHLTALTRLESSGTGTKAGSVLPDSLVAIELGGIRGGSHLRSLRNLQVIRLSDLDGDANASVLDLTALSALSHVELSYTSDAGEGHTSSDLWRSLPLKRLFLNVIHNVDVQHLSNLQHLTALTLHNCSFNCSPTEFAAALKTLTRLENLTIDCSHYGAFCMFWQQGNAVDVCTVLSFLNTLAGDLPNLQKLRLFGISKYY